MYHIGRQITPPAYDPWTDPDYLRRRAWDHKHHGVVDAAQSDTIVDDRQAVLPLTKLDQ
jgi:hypothetical protein